MANLYLDHLDEEIHRRGVRIVRFADDFVILCKRRKSAEALLEETEELLKTLGLELNSAKTRLVDFDKGFEFLGYLFVKSLAIKRQHNELTVASKAEPVAKPGKAKSNRRWTEPVQEVSDFDEVENAPVTRTDHDTGDRVLYVLERGRHLDVGSSAFTILDREGDELAMIGQHRVDRIEIGTGVSLSEDTLQHCIANHIPLTFVNGFGAPRAELRKPEKENAALQLSQASSCLNRDFQITVSRALVDARIRNQRTQLFRLNRNPKNEKIDQALERTKRHLRKLDEANTVDKLRGLEGAVAAEYWKALGYLTKGAATPFIRQRPASDLLNATINYLTWKLHRDTISAILTARLHPGFGFLHAVREYADALVYDLMEPFRAPLTEGLAAFLFNSNRLKPEMFESENANTVHILPPARNAIVSGYEQYVSKRIRHNGSSRKFGWRRVMLRQSYDLANAVKNNDASLFKPYLMET